MATTTVLTAGTKLADLDTAQVRQLQTLLVQAGYDVGGIDGVMGPKTQAAYGRFITNNGYQLLPGVTSQVVVQSMADLSIHANDDTNVWSSIRRGGELQANGQPASTASVSATAAPVNTVASSGDPSVAAATAASTSTPYVPAPDAATEESVRQRYPHLAYLLTIPDVRQALLDATSRGWTEDELQGALYKTEWWQKTASNMRLWDQKWNQDNATAVLEWDQRTLSIMNSAQKAGVPIDQEGAKWVAGKVLREGWDDDQLNRFLGDLVRQAGGAGFGSIRESQAQLQQTAASFLTHLTDKDSLEYATRIMEGSASRDTIVSMLRDQAKTRFSWLAPQLDAGLTAMDLFRQTRNAVAQQLEIDPETIDLNNVKWSALTNPISENGQMRSMNYSEAQKWARQQSEWRYTSNANKEVSDKTFSLLQNLGILKGS